MRQKKKNGITNIMTNEKTIVDPRMCKAHRMWMRKGQCEMCRLEADKLRQEREKLTGSNKPEVKIIKL